MVEFLKHTYKEFFRSSVWQKSAFINGLMGLGFLYLAANFWIIGYFAGDILMAIFPGESPITNLNYGLLYYFLIDLFLRFYVQPLPVMGVIPYLHLPIKKSSLIHFTLLRSAFTVFNTSILVFAIPFAMGWIAKYESTLGAFLWVVLLFAFNGINNFLIVYFKRVFAEKPAIVLGFGALLGLLIALEYHNFIHIGQFSVYIFDGVIYQPLVIVAPLLMLLASYFWVFNYYKQNAYLESLSDAKKKNIKTVNLTFLERFEQIGKLIELELKLIWRNKRPKSVAIVSFIFVGYGFILYPTNNVNAISLIFFGLIITGMFLLNYGQFLLSWESGYFDMLLARNVQMKDYVKAKYYMFVASIVVAFLLSLVYFYFGTKVVLFNAAIAVFNIGITIWVVLYAATFSPKKIDLSKSSFFNYQGTGAQQFILMVPVLLLPTLVYGTFYLIGGENTGLAALFGFGIVGILLTNVLQNIITQRLREKRYTIASNFRE